MSENGWNNPFSARHKTQDIRGSMQFTIQKPKSVPLPNQPQRLCPLLLFFFCYITAAYDLHTHNYNPYSCNHKNASFFPGVIISEYYCGTGPNEICLASKNLRPILTPEGQFPCINWQRGHFLLCTYSILIQVQFR